MAFTAVGGPSAAAAIGGIDAWSPAALSAAVPALAWWLLLGNLFWVLAYDTEYAMVDRDDDLVIGIKTSAITLSRFNVVGVMAFYAAYLLIWGFLDAQLGYGWLHFSALAAAAAIAGGTTR